MKTIKAHEVRAFKHRIVRKDGTRLVVEAKLRHNRVVLATQGNLSIVLNHDDSVVVEIIDGNPPGGQMAGLLSDPEGTPKENRVGTVVA